MGVETALLFCAIVPMTSRNSPRPSMTHRS